MFPWKDLPQIYVGDIKGQCESCMKTEVNSSKIKFWEEFEVAKTCLALLCIG